MAVEVLIAVSCFTRYPARMAEMSVADLATDPMEQVRRWVADAQAAGVPEWDAMMVATADASGAPSARMVLLRGIEDAGFRFYSNYASRKATELSVNSRAALVIYWREQQRQIRAIGSVSQLTPEESLDYWSRRPRSSQLSAWASYQSAPIDNRTTLEEEVTKIEQQFSDQDEIPRPSFWGGYLISPTEVEFWAHRDNRLHDRLVYRKDSGANWNISRLQP